MEGLEKLVSPKNFSFCPGQAFLGLKLQPFLGLEGQILWIQLASAGRGFQEIVWATNDIFLGSLWSLYEVVRCAFRVRRGTNQGV